MEEEKEEEEEKAVCESWESMQGPGPVGRRDGIGREGRSGRTGAGKGGGEGEEWENRSREGTSGKL